MELLSQHPDLPLGTFAELLKCSIRDLQAIDRFVKAYRPKWEFVSTFLDGKAHLTPATTSSTVEPAITPKRVVSIKRKRLTAIDEIAGEGVVVSEDLADVPANADPVLPALNVRQMSSCEDFVSSPDASPMTKDDICNIEFVAAAELKETLQRIARRLRLDVVESDPLAPEAAWGDDWDEDDKRWMLTPHALRKLKPRKYAAMK